MRIFFLIFLFIFCSLSIFAEDFSVIVKEVRGFAFIERKDKTQSFSVFRGSEIKENNLIKTDSKSQIILTVMQSGSRICDLFLNSDTVLLVNKVLFSSDNKISLSLLQGRMKVQMLDFTNKSTLTVHTANMSSFISKGEVEVAFSMDGSSIIYLISGSAVASTDVSSINLGPNETYVLENNNYTFSKSSVNPEIFINVNEDRAVRDVDSTFAILIDLMKEVNNQFIILDSDLRDVERQSDELLLVPVETKAHRLLSANEGYYHTATRLLDIAGIQSRNAFEFTKMLNNLYFSNNRYIDKINMSLQKNKSRIDRTKKLY